jgi:hypothetical protein
MKSVAPGASDVSDISVVVLKMVLLKSQRHIKCI